MFIFLAYALCRAMAPTMPNLAPSGPRTAPTPAFVSIVTTFGPLAAPHGPLFVTRKTQRMGVLMKADLDDEQLWKAVVGAALELPASELYPFNEECDAARVCGKWFMISTVRGKRMVNLKADPQDARALCESFESITPGYHMNKKYWITVMPGPGINDELVRELVMESYLLVVDGLPKYQQPVDPASFGSHGS